MLIITLKKQQNNFIQKISKSVARNYRKYGNYDINNLKCDQCRASISSGDSQGRNEIIDPVICLKSLFFNRFFRGKNTNFKLLTTAFGNNVIL